MPERGPLGKMAGKDMTLDDVEYELDHMSEGSYHGVILTLDLGFADLELSFEQEKAEQFVIEFRDELVKAKQADLEWQTNTDPSSGVAETDGGEP